MYKNIIDLHTQELVNKIRDDIYSFKSKDINNFIYFKIENKSFLLDSFHRLAVKIPQEMELLLPQYFSHEDTDSSDLDSVICEILNKTNEKELLSLCENFKHSRDVVHKKITSLKENLNNSTSLEASETIVSFLGKRQCNLRCRYCFVEKDKENNIDIQDGDLSEEIIKTALDFTLENSKNTLFIRIDYSLGGEVLLDFENFKKILPILNSYKNDIEDQKDVVIGFLTNGTLLNDEIIEWLNKNHNQIGFSLDGCKEVNDSMRKFEDGKGSYDEAIGNIKKIINLNWRFAPGVSSVLTAKNPDILKNFLDLWDIGFRVIITKPVRSSEDNDFSISNNMDKIKASYTNFANFLIENCKKGNFEYLKAILYPIDFFGRFLIRIFIRDKIFIKRCAAGKKIFSIRNNGDIYPCDSFNGMGMHLLGNINNRSIDDTTFRIPFVDEIEKCSNCWARYLCGGPCAYTQTINGGDRIIESECELTKFILMLSCYLWSEVKSVSSEEELKDLNDFISLVTHATSW
ncbi:MAG: SPASM domain-containing protein [Clostridia bacterium]|nr:SPASM domain-containing protein [Clostridia bacterium]